MTVASSATPSSFSQFRDWRSILIHAISHADVEEKTAQAASRM
jgi:hypothetical protein